MAHQAIDRTAVQGAHSVELHSGEYVQRYNRKSLDRVRALAQQMRIADDAEIADFACGNGMLLQAIGDRTGGYTGIDFSTDFITSAIQWAGRSRLSNFEFICADIIDFAALNPEKFDVGATLDFSEHIDDELAVRIYSAIFATLKPGGKLYLHTPNLDFFVEQAKEKGLLRQFPEHIAVRNGPQTENLLVEAGFDRTKIRTRHIAHYNILKHVHPLRHLPFFGKFFKARLWIEAEV